MMKTRILLGCLGFMLLIFLGGCDKPNGEPPRILSESQDYQLPEIKLLTLEEREEIRLLKEEYNNAIKDL
jgi:lipoprotein